MLPFAFLPTFRAWDLTIVAAVCFLIFGSRLPSVMRALREGVRALREGVSGPRPPWQP